MHKLARSRPVCLVLKHGRIRALAPAETNHLHGLAGKLSRRNGCGRDTTHAQQEMIKKSVGGGRGVFILEKYKYARTKTMVKSELGLMEACLELLALMCTQKSYACMQGKADEARWMCVYYGELTHTRAHHMRTYFYTPDFVLDLTLTR